MQLRPALPEDAEALGELGRSSFVAAFGEYYDPADLQAFLDQVYAPAAVLADIRDPDRIIRLADEGGTLTGFCKLGLDRSYAEHARGHSPVDLMQLYTDPALTGQGIGASLMDWALDEARSRGGDEIMLSVWSENFGAQRFYRRYGFEKIADIDFWVGNHRDDEFLFARMLCR